MSRVKSQPRPILAFFSSPLASACEVARVILSRQIPGFSDHVDFFEVSVPSPIAVEVSMFAIEQLPCLILFHEGREVERLEALLPSLQMREFLRQCVSYYV